MKFKIIFTVTVVSLLSLQSFAQRESRSGTAQRQGNVVGKITDVKTGAPLQGASILFPDLGRYVISEKDGSFRVNNIPAGNHLLNISFVGYKTIIENIAIDGNSTRDFSMTSSFIENAGVIVTGTASGSYIRDIATPVLVLKKEELAKTASTNIIDAISHLPGVAQLSTGPAISKPYIRGLGYNRVITMSNGIRQEGQQWGDEHGIEIDEYNVDRIEILKGPASLMYGSDGLAGVINVISNIPVPPASLKVNINSGFQTNAGLYFINSNIAGNKNGFNWNVYGTYKAAHDYKNKYDGYVFNSKFHNTDFGGSIGINKGWGFSRLTYSRFDQKLGLVEGERDASGRFVKIVGTDMNGEDSIAVATNKDFKSYNPYIGSQRIIHQKLALENSFYLKNRSHITLTGGWQLNQRREFPDINEPGVPGLYFHLRSFTYDAKYFFPSQNKWETAIGLSGMQQENQNLGVEFLIPAYDFFDAGGFVYTKKSFGNLTLSGGARYDNRKLNSGLLEEAGAVKFAPFKRNFGNVSASIGAAFILSSGVTAKLNVARGFRAPNIAELAANGVHEGTIKYEYGNTDLKSETSLETDAGIDISTEHLSLTVSLFYNNIRNYIFSRKLNSVAGTDSIPTVANDEGFSAFKYFQTNANLYGAECMIDIHPHPIHWLHFQNTFSIVRAISSFKTDSTKNLPNIPAPRWVSELQANINTGGFARNFYIKFSADGNFDQNKIFSAYKTETSTPGYILFNGGFGGDIIARNKQTICSLFFSANNITDKAYQSHLSRLKYAPENMVTGRSGVFNMGRNFSIRISVPLSFKI